MKAPRATIITQLLFFFLLVGLTAHAQTPESNTKNFTRDGLVFDYPNGWTLDDRSNKDAQQLSLSRSDSNAQISIFVHRGKVDTPEKMAVARRTLIDPYITKTSNDFVQMGAKPESVPAKTQIGGAEAEGVRLRATLDGEAGEAAIYWLTLGNRVVVMTFFGPDKALKQATPVWDAIRTNLHIEEIKPAPKATPK